VRQVGEMRYRRVGQVSGFRDRRETGESGLGEDGRV
jgi:hypothetical protein